MPFTVDISAYMVSAINCYIQKKSIILIIQQFFFYRSYVRPLFWSVTSYYRFIIKHFRHLSVSLRRLILWCAYYCQGMTYGSENKHYVFSIHTRQHPLGANKRRISNEIVLL